jgi:hypothetical protein
LCAKVNGLVCRLSADLGHPGVLQPLLKLTYVGIANWPRRRVRAWSLAIWGEGELLRQYRGAKHFVEREGFCNFRRGPHCDH